MMHHVSPYIVSLCIDVFSRFFPWLFILHRQTQHRLDRAKAPKRNSPFQRPPPAHLHQGQGSNELKKTYQQISTALKHPRTFGVSGLRDIVSEPPGYFMGNTLVEAVPGSQWQQPKKQQRSSGLKCFHLTAEDAYLEFVSAVLSRTK